MNKKVSTLLAGIALMGTMSAYADEPTSITNKNLFQLTVSGKVLSVEKSKVSSADSLVMITSPEGVTTDAYKKTLWKLTEVKVPNTSTIAYTLTNFATGADLNLDLSKTGAKNGAIITTGKQGNWFVAGEDGNVKITAISGGDTYSLEVGDDKVTLEKAPAMTDFTLTIQKTALAMTAGDLNNLYGSSFVFDFKEELEGNPIDGLPIKAATGEVDDCVTLQLADGKYLVVDTTRWANTVNENEYWKLTTDTKPSEELGDDQPGAVAFGTLLTNGRAKELYEFKVTLNVAAGYVMTITPAYLPYYYATDDKEEGKQEVPSYGIPYDDDKAVANELPLSYGKFASDKNVLTAPGAEGLTAATATFGAVEIPDAIDADYVYYVKYKNTYADGKKNKALNKFAYLDCEGELAYIAKTLEIPSYMWFLDDDATLVSMMDEDTDFTGTITLIDEEEGIYAFGTDTLQLVKGPKIEDAQDMAFKSVTKADEANGALSFRLVSSIADDLYVVEKDGKLYVANSTLADAMKLKVVAEEDVLTIEGSNGVKVPVYALTDRLGKRKLAALSDGASLGDNLALVADDYAGDYDFIRLAFMATGKENQYKIVGVAGSDITSLAATANAGSGLLEIGSVCADKNVTFEFAQKEAPIYAAPAIGHVKITTREDDGKFLASQTDGFAALKAAGQELKSDVYTSDTLTMWLDTASTTFNETMPLYYISTNAFVSGVEGNTRNYLINPYQLSEDIDKANEDAEEMIENNYIGLIGLRAVFAPASVCGQDSLAFNGDTINMMQLNPAAVAFEVAAEYGDEYYRIKSNLCLKNEDYDPAGEESLPYEDTDPLYLVQLNNVLYWTTAEADDIAEIFVINRASTPTANDATPSVTEVKVIASEGAIQIIGAQGKKVVVSNILGQVIANTVISSSDATIAVPAGIVVVAVEGEEAVKAIVK